MSDRRATRRAALAAGAGAALPLLVPAPARAAERVDERTLLRRLAAVERRSVLAYERAATSDRLSEPVAQLMELLRGQEERHAQAVEAALRQLGERPPSPPPDVAGLSAAARRGQGPLLRFLIGLEERAIGAWIDAIGELEDPLLLDRAASVAASEAQHLVVLRQAAGRPALGASFEAGAPR